MKQDGSRVASRFSAPDGWWPARDHSNVRRNDGQRKPRLRWLLIWAVAVVWMVAVVGRLAYLQLYCYGDYFAKAQRQQQRTFEVSPPRGDIYDRKGRELAISIPMDSVFADPSDMNDPGMVARLLAPALDIPPAEIEQKIRDASKPVRIAKKLAPETVERIDEMNLKGVFFQKENRRVYPLHELAAHVLGYVDTDEKGIGGIEHSLRQMDSRQAGARRSDGGRKAAALRPARSGCRSGRKRDANDRRDAAIIAEKNSQRECRRPRQERRGFDSGSEHGRAVGGRELACFDPNDAGKYRTCADGPRGDRGIRARLDVQDDHDGGSARTRADESERNDRLPDGQYRGGRTVDSRSQAVRGVDRDGGTRGIERRRDDQDRGTHGARTLLQTIRDFGFGVADGNRVAGREPRALCGRRRIGDRVRSVRWRWDRK